LAIYPVIDASPTELSTVNEILNRSEEIANKLDLKYMCLVFEEAIYAKIQQIRWKEERYLSRFPHGNGTLWSYIKTLQRCWITGIVFFISLFFPSRSDQKII
jgi:hypothetical protein